LTRSDTRDLTKLIKDKSQGEETKNKPYVFNYIPSDNKTYKLRIEFKKQVVTRQELISILEDVIKKLKYPGLKIPIASKGLFTPFPIN